MMFTMFRLVHSKNAASAQDPGKKYDRMIGTELVRRSINQQTVERSMEGESDVREDLSCTIVISPPKPLHDSV